MKLPITGWDRTLKALGRKVVWKRTTRRPRVNSGRQQQYEKLEPRQLLASIAIGDVASDLISVPNEVDQWEFQAAAGQEVFLDFQQHDNPVGFSLFAPDGSLVVEGDSYDPSRPVFALSEFGSLIGGPIELASAGEYELQVSAFFGSTPNYQFQLREALPADEQVLDIGDVFNGEIETQNSQDHFTFDATAGQTLWLDVLQIDGAVQYALEGPDGDVLWTGSSFDDSNDIGPVDILSDGTHTLKIYGYDGGLSTYSFQLLEAPAPDVQTIDVGDTVSGEIETVGSRDQWEFSVGAGEEVELSFLQQTSPLAFNILAPDGSLFAEGFSYDTSFPPEIYLVGPREFEGIGEEGFPEEGPIEEGPIEGGPIEGGPIEGGPIEGGASNGVVTFPEAGNYILQIEWDGDGLPAYEFTLREPLPENLFAIGDVVDDQIQATGVVDDWMFEANAGQTIEFDLQSASDLLRYRVIAPDGSVLVSLGPQDGEGVARTDFRDQVRAGLLNSSRLTLAETGTFFIEIEGVDGTTPDYGFAVQEVPAPDTQSLNIGDIVNGDLETSDAADYWTFSATGGQAVFLDFLSSSVGVDYRLLGPNGGVVASGGHTINDGLTINQGSADQGPVNLTTSGTYTLEVQGLEEIGLGAYQFQAIEYSIPDTQSLAIGDTVSGSIETELALDHWTFQATAGQSVFLDFANVSDNLIFTLFAPDGQVLGSDLWIAFSGGEGGPFELEDTGTYTVQIAGEDEGTPTYDFELVEVPAPDVLNLNIGDTVSGSIEVPGARDQWLFSADSGQQVLLDFLQASDTLSYELRRPSGSLLASRTSSSTSTLDRGPLTLSEAGVYSLTIEGDSGSTPSYAFELRDPTPANVQNINLNDIVSSEITSSGAQDHWVFTATAGQSVFVDFGDFTETPSYILEGPSGEVIINSLAGGENILDRGAVGLTSSGEYTLKVRGLNGTQPAYTFQLWDVPAPAVQQVTIDEIIQGQISVPGAQEHWEFDAVAGQQVYLDTQSSDGGSVRLELLAPDGGVLRSASDGERLVTLPTDGMYTLRVNSLGDDIPTYQVRVWDVPAPRVSRIVVDQVETSTIQTPSAEDHWTFAAGSDEIVSVDFLSVDGGPLEYQIFAPDGSLAFSQSSSSIAAELDSGLLTFTDAGEYRIEINSRLNLRPAYQFRVSFGVANLQAAEVTAPTIAFTGQEIEIQWTVSNLGNRATNSAGWIDSVFLENVVSNAITLLGAVPNSAFLNGGDSYTSSGSFTLPSTLVGEFNVVVATDRDNGVAELDDDDNSTLSAAPLVIELSPQSDLIVSEVTSPVQVFSGQTANVVWTVENQGGASTGAATWSDTVYLSDDAVLDESDVVVGNAERPNIDLGTGDSYQSSTFVQIPVGISGEYYFLVETDSNDQLLEFGLENNNVGFDSSPTTVNLTPPPDLEVGQVSTPPNALASRELEVSYRVTNFGATETPNTFWTDALYLSQDNALDLQTDILLDSQTHTGSLEVGDFYDSLFVATLPDGIDGDWYVIVASDSSNLVFEIDDDNNIAVSDTPVSVESRPADLAIVDVSVPSSIAIGQGLLFGWTVGNAGVGDTVVSQWRDQVVLSEDEVLGNEDDISLATVAREQILDAGASYNVTNELISLPEDVLPGNYFIFVSTDTTDSVFEADATANNHSAATPISVQRAATDLVISAVTAPTNAVSGQVINVTWNVRNIGTVITDANYWQDAVYLSPTPSVDESSILLGRKQRTNPLASGGQYLASAEFQLPIDLVGEYYIIVQTDSENDVFEGGADENNQIASTSRISVSPATEADLQVVDIVAPSSIVSGQTVELTWTVLNAGDNDIVGRRWTDSVYLSLNTSLDIGSDVRLGFADGSVDLAAGEQYTQTASFYVPPGLSGPFFFVIATDSNRQVAEGEDESNNTNAAAVSVRLPQPVDLVVGEIVVPESVVGGQQFTIDYTVENQSENPAFGGWVDSIFLSADGQWDINDPLLGRVEHQGDVTGGASYSESLTAELPGVLPGEYHVIIRSDILNRIVESDETNNIGASLDRAAIDFEQILLDSPETATVANGASVYYRVEVEAGETLLVNVGSQNLDATAEVFVAYDSVPTRASFDFAGIEPFQSNQFASIPITEAGTYYILVSGNDSVSGSQDLTTSVRLLQFESIDTDFGLGGNAGNLTIEVNGAKFDRSLVGRLTNSSGVDVSSQATYINDSTNAYLTFDLRGLPAGRYDVVLENGDGEGFVTADSFEVVEGGGAEIISSISAPETLRLGQSNNYPIVATWANSGLNDAYAPVLEVTNSSAFGLAIGQHDLGNSYRFLGTTTDGGPAGILRPGMSESVRFYATAPDELGTSTATINQRYKDLSALFNWETLRESLRPSTVSEEQFEPIFRALQESVGGSVGDYIQMLSQNSSLLSAAAGDNRNIALLASLEVDRVRANLQASVSGFVSQAPVDLEVAGLQLFLGDSDTGIEYSTTVLNDGSYSFVGVQPGRYSISTADPSLLVRSFEDAALTIDVGDQGNELHNVKIETGAKLLLEVLSASSGTSITEVSLSLTNQEGVGFIPALTDTGQFSFLGLSDGTYTVVATAAGYAREIQSLEITGDNSEAVISLLEESSIVATVTIDGVAATADDVILITATRTGSANAGDNFTTLVEGDSILLAGVAPGRYDVAIANGTSFTTLKDVLIAESTATDLGEISLETPVASLLETSDAAIERETTALAVSKQLSANLRKWANASPAEREAFRREIEPALLAIEAELLATFIPALVPVYGIQVANLYLSFLLSTPESPQFGPRFVDYSTVVEGRFGQAQGFRQSKPVIDAFEEVLRLAAKEAFIKLEDRAASGTLTVEKDEFREQTITFPVEALVPKEKLIRNSDNFDNVLTIPGLIAGRGNSRETRTVTGEVIAHINGNGVVEFESKLKYQVDESIDFVFGNLGASIELPFTGQLAILEAFGHANPVPYQVEITERQGTFAEGDFQLNAPSDDDQNHNEGAEELGDCPNDGQSDSSVLGSFDPNDILGPSGFGEQNFIAADQPLEYTIRFENDADLASAPAQVVSITQQLDSDLDFRTFRVGDFAIGSHLIEVPANRSFYSDRVDLSDELGVLVDVAIGIDVQTGEAFWNLTSIDPSTGDVPENPLSGFLAPNVNSPEGEGFVSYSIEPKSSVVSGDVIDAEARIVFDINEPIDTPPIFNTLDVVAPNSTIDTLPSVAAGTNFEVRWSGTDDEDGSAIAGYSIYVSVDGRPHEIWLENTQLNSAIYVGEPGRSYEFYSVARDNAGNAEVAPVTADAVTQTEAVFGNIGDLVWLDANGNGIFDDGESGYEGVTVNLFVVDDGESGQFVASATTDENGRYQFADLDTSDRYFLEFVSVEGFGFSDLAQGVDDALDSDADINTGRTLVFSINEGDNFTWNAGLIPLGSIGGVVWQDVDGDSIQDSDEPLLENFTVYLDANDDGVLDVDEQSILTNSDGRYEFTGLRPGEYKVAQIIPDDWEQTFPGVSGATGTYTLTASQSELFAPGEAIETENGSAGADLVNLGDLNADPAFAGVDGTGYSVVVIDTGIDVDHSFFGPDTDGDGVADRIVYQYDFADGDNDASDVTGHGSHVTSIISSEDAQYRGIAPGADIIHLKVFEDGGAGTFAYVEQALQWVVENAAFYSVAAINLSIGDGGNWSQATGQYGLGDELAALASMNVITVSAAGNNFAQFGSETGVAYPAADPNTIAVGAVWDADRGGPFTFGGAGTDFTTGADQITNFSQRHGELTDTFAPGAIITGASADGGIAARRGTSMASPFVTGAAVLAQQVAVQTLGRSLSTYEFRALLSDSGSYIYDGDDENDSVVNTGLDFTRLDVHALVTAVASLDGDPIQPETNIDETESNSSEQVGPLASQSYSFTVQLGVGEVRDDVNFGARPVNTAPTIDVGSAVSITEGQTISRSGTFSDPDPTDSWTATVDYGDGSEPVPLTLDGSTFQLSHQYTNDGNYIVVVEVTDAAGETGAAEFEVTVENAAPVVAVDIETITVPEGETAVNTGIFSDPGLDTVALSASTGVVSDNGDGTWSWTWDTSDGPTESQTVTITATDGDGASTDVTFELVVENETPEIAANNPDVTVDEGATATNSGTFGDIGADQVTLSASIGTIVDNSDGTWSWAFDTNDGPAESQTVSVIATDSDGAIASAEFQLTVNNVAPVVDVENLMLSVTEGETASNSGTFSDLGADTINLSTSLGSVSDNGDGTWSWTWDTSDGPDDSATVTVTATDSDGASTDVMFDLDVENVAPNLVVNDQVVTVNEGESAANEGIYGDVASDTVSITASIGTIVDNGNGTWSWSFDTSDGPAESQTVTITATDSDEASTGVSFELVVNNVVPEIDTEQPVVSVEEGDTATNSGTFSDIGNDSIILSASVGTVVDNEDGTWSWSFDTADGPDDSQVVTITATDSEGAESTVSFDLIVENVAPVISADQSTVMVDAGSTVGATGTFSDVGSDTVVLNASVGEITDNGDGTWAWSLDAAGEPIDSQIVSVTATDSDGEQTTVSFELIVNQQVAAVISGDVSGSATEDMGVSGLLSISDANGTDEEAFQAQVIQATYGQIAVQTDGSWQYTPFSTPVTQAIRAGQTVSDTFTLTSVDGTTVDVIVLINGVNDPATFPGTAPVQISEDATASLTGQINVVDRDAEESEIIPSQQIGSYGVFEIDATGQWSYTVDNAAANPAPAGQDLNDFFVITSLDGTEQDFLVEVVGANDAAVITGELTGTIDEDSNTPVRGTLEVSDADFGEARFAAQPAQEHGEFGTFQRTGGLWSYSVDGDAVANLNSTESVTDSFEVSSFDGSATVLVTITVEGRNDHFDDAVSTEVGVPVTFNVLDNDQVAGEVIITSNLAGQGGDILIGIDGNVTYTPSENANLNGTDSFQLTFVDENGNIARSNVLVTINPTVEGGDTSGFNLVGVNDWFNSASGTGGFIATYEYTVSENSIIGDDLFAWGLQSGYSGSGEITNVYLEGFNGATSSGAGGSFDIGNIDVSYRPELNVGDSFRVSFQVDGTAFDNADFSPAFFDSDPEPFEPDASDVVISAAPTNDWGSGFVQNVEIDNISQQAISGWSVILDVPAGDTFDLSNVWGATAETLDNGDILFTNLSWNENIPAGGSISFGFLGDNSTSATVMLDSGNFSLANTDIVPEPEPEVADSSEVAISAAPTNDWGSGFVQNVEIDNISQQAISGWSVILDVPEDDTFNLSNVWGATAETLENGDILFSNLSWNQDISVDGSINFGFQGDNATIDMVMIEEFDFTWI